MSGSSATGEPRGCAVFLEAYPHLRGGAQRVNLELASALDAHGWRSQVVAPGEGPAIDALRATGVPVVVLPAGPAIHRYGRSRPSARTATDLLRWWGRLSGHLRRRVDRAVLLVSDQRGLILGAPGARLARVPMVWHVHSAEQSQLLRTLGAVAAASIVAPSRRTADRMPGHRTWVVPNGVAAAGPAPPAAAPQPAILTVGRLHPDKDLGLLLDAVGRLRPAWPDLRTTIVGAEQPGHEAYARALHARVTGTDLEATVVFAGHRDDPFAGADDRTVYVQASARETFGLALAEAMARGLAVVTTATDGAADLVDDDRTGLVVPAGDPGALAAAADRLLGDPVLARRLGDAARADVLRRFSHDAMIAAELRVLTAVAGS